VLDAGTPTGAGYGGHTKNRSPFLAVIQVVLALGFEPSRCSVRLTPPPLSSVAQKVCRKLQRGMCNSVHKITCSRCS